MLVPIVDPLRGTFNIACSRTLFSHPTLSPDVVCNKPTSFPLQPLFHPILCHRLVTHPLSHLTLRVNRTFHLSFSHVAAVSDCLHRRPSRTAKRKGKQRVRVRSPSPPPLSTTAATSTPPGDVASQTPADTSSSSDPTPTPATAASSNSALFPVTAGSKVTMAELVARHTAKAVVSGAVTPSPPKKITMKIGNGYYVRKCLVLPEKCEVTDPDKWDPLLALIYAKLPHLK